MGGQDHLWIILAVNSIGFGGLLFLLSAGFALIFGPMRIPNLMHGSFLDAGRVSGSHLPERRRELLDWVLASAAAVAVM